MDFRFSIIGGKTIHEIVHSEISECVRCVREAYLAHGRGDSINPDSYFLRFPERPRDRIIALPAYLGAGVRVAGLKWISSFPENVQRGFPRASAVVILNDRQTGYPFACLEGSIISAARTAASAALAAEALNGGRRAARRLGIVGNGLIARYVHTFLTRLGWEIDELWLHDVVPAESERFAERARRAGTHRRIECASDVEGLLRACDLVLLATVAAEPYVLDPALLDHKPIVLNVSLRDLAPEILLRSHNVVDDVEHVMKANTSPHLAEKLTGGRDFVAGTLAQVMNGEVRLDRSKPIVFSPFGLGVLDLAVAKWVYDVAEARGGTTEVPDFFWELTR